MSREEASVIARSLCDRIGLSGHPLKWQTTEELPTPVEVPEFDYDLQDAFALAGYDPQPTLYFLSFALSLRVLTPYDEQNYIYWCSNFKVIVNAYSGRAMAKWEDSYPEGTSVLSSEQLENIAYQLVQAFLGNRPWRWTNKHIPSDPVDLWAYFLAQTFDQSSNAYLLDCVSITLSAITGELLGIIVYQCNVNIPTHPLIMREEAWKLAEEALKNAHPGATIIRTEEPELFIPLQLFVFEDSLRQQFLVWEFYYYLEERLLQGRIIVDAHTGEVLQIEDFIPMGAEAPCTHRVFKGNSLIVNGKQINLGRCLLLRNGRIYLWEGYLPFFKVELQGKRLVAWDRKVSLAKANLMEFQGKRYVTLRDVCAIAGIRLWWDNERKVPVLRAEWLEAKRLLAKRAKSVP